MSRRLREAGRVLLRVLLAGVCVAAAGAHTAFAAESLLNKKAPEFTRKDLNGQMLDLAGLRGKVVLLNFWATWCAPCQLEMPVFAAWQRQYGPRGLQVIGISMDDDATPARRVVARLKLNYPVVMGDERLGTRYGGVMGLPLTFLIDRNGVVRARFQGETDIKSIERQVTALLAPTRTPARWRMQPAWTERRAGFRINPSARAVRRGPQSGRQSSSAG